MQKLYGSGHRIVCVFAVVFFLWATAIPVFAQREESPPAAGDRLDNNLKCVDLTDLTGPLPLTVDSSHEILRPGEDWERSTWPGDEGRATVGYPTVVRNVHGENPDGRYYLYYAHHDPNSGIGCAVADAVTGPYRKLAELDADRADSRVLINRGKPGEGYHYSSPCAVWNPDRRLWVMYFHFGSWSYHYADGWNRGYGDQMTAMATCPDLASHQWTPLVDASLTHIPAGQLPLVPVLPTTAERWMNSQSSYHAVQRLPDGRWLAFLRGTGMSPERKQGLCKLGFATSADGAHWDYFPENPIIHQEDGGGGRQGIYRPHFVGYLGDGEYLLCWSESQPYDGGMQPIYGFTRDFKTVRRDPRGCATWAAADGLITPWREGNKLYLFAGRQVHVMTLPVGGEENR